MIFLAHLEEACVHPFNNVGGVKSYYMYLLPKSSCDRKDGFHWSMHI